MKHFITIIIALVLSHTCHAQLITTFAGNGLLGYSGDGMPANTSMLSVPIAVTVDDSGNVYIADYWNYRVRKVNTSGIITTVAGTGISGYSGDDSMAVNAQLYGPWSLAVDKKHNLYIADLNNQRIRKVDPAGIITTVAGNGTGGYSGDGGPATQAMVNWPTGVAVDDTGNLYIADQYNSRIRKVDTFGIITTFAGSATAGYSGDGGQATAAELTAPISVATDHLGNVYISDAGNYVIRRVNTAGVISTIAGNGQNGNTAEGQLATSTHLPSPWGVAADRLGNVYIANAGAATIERVDPSGYIYRYAGTGQGYYGGDNGPALSASLSSVAGIALSPLGDLYIASYDDARIRKVSAIQGRVHLCLPDTATLSELFAGGTWIMGDTTIATIDVNTGFIQAQAIGNTRVYYTLGADTSFTEISVAGALPVVDSITGPSQLCAGGWAPMNDSTPDGLWSVSNNNCYVYANGTVWPVAAGTDTVIYTVTNGCGATSVQKEVQIISGSAGEIAGPDSICPGDTVLLSENISDGTWSNTATGITAMLAPGQFKALAPGVDTIFYTVTTAVCGTLTASFPLTVKSYGACDNEVSTIAVAEGINVYPNPSSGYINIELPFSASQWSVAIIDLYGKSLLSKSNVTSGNMQLDLSSFIPGTYLLKLRNANTYHTRKLIIR